MQMSLRELLAELVSIDSVSSRSIVEIICYLEECCGELGLSVRRYSYKDEAGVEKVNLICVAGLAEGMAQEVDLALVGHTDTVPLFRPIASSSSTHPSRQG